MLEIKTRKPFEPCSFAAAVRPVAEKWESESMKNRLIRSI
jgi:hypothetical protein